MNRYVVAAVLGLLVIPSVALAQEASSTKGSASQDGWEVSAEAAEEAQVDAPKPKPKRKAEKGKKADSTSVVVDSGEPQEVKVRSGQTVVVVSQASAPPPPPPPLRLLLPPARVTTNTTASTFAAGLISGR